MKKVLKRIISSPVISTSRDPARVTTKGLRNMTFTSSPFPETSLLGKNSYKADQEKMKAFYRHNPTLAHASSNHNVDVDDEEVPQVPVHSTTAAPTANPPPEFFAQLIKTMKNIQVPQQPSKIVVNQGITKKPSTLLSCRTECYNFFTRQETLTGMTALLKISKSQHSCRVFETSLPGLLPSRLPS